MLRRTLPWIMALALCGAGEAQNQAFIPDNLASSGTCNSFPFGQNGAFTYLARVPASALAGLSGLRVLDVAFAPCTSGTWTSPTVTIALGHLPNPQPCPFTFPPVGGGTPTSFLDFTIVYDAAVSGSLTWHPVSNTWTPLGLATTGGTNFYWNGVNDVGFFLTFNSATYSNGFDGTCHRTNTEPARTVTNAFWAPTSTTCANAAGLKMRLDFSSAQAEWETNGPDASLDVDGITTSGFGPIDIVRCANQPHVAHLSTLTNTGHLWNAGFTAGPLVSRTSGGSGTSSGQVVNLNLADSSFIALFGPASAQPFASTSLPLSFAQPFDVSAQISINDPANADGFALSAPVRLHIIPITTSAPGPTGDDAYVTIPLGAPPLCGSNPIPFFGTLYSQMHVVSNGRVIFGTPNTSFQPAAATALTESGWAGAWCDLNPLLGGTIVASITPASIIRVDYLGVPYFGLQAVPLTFNVQFDPSTGAVTIDGLSGIGSNTLLATQMIGLCAGTPLATDPGATAFALGGPHPGPAGHGMTYALGVGGSLTPGLSGLIFVPNTSGNYDWTGY